MIVYVLGVPHPDEVNGEDDVFYSTPGDANDNKPVGRQLPSVPDTPPLTPNEIKRIKHAELAKVKQAAKQKAKAKTDEQIGITPSPAPTKSSKSSKKERIKYAPGERKKGELGKVSSLAAFPSPTFSKKREKGKSLERNKSAPAKTQLSGKENEKKQRRSLLSMFMPNKKEHVGKGRGNEKSYTGTGGSDKSKTPNTEKKFMRHKPRAKTANLRAIEKEMGKRVSLHDEFNPLFEDIYGDEANPRSDQQKVRLKEDIAQKLEMIAPSKESELGKIAPRATGILFESYTYWYTVIRLMIITY